MTTETTVRTITAGRTKIGDRVRIRDGRWGKVEHRSVTKTTKHSRGTVTKEADTVQLWVVVDGWGRTTMEEYLKTDELEVER